jgi:hypothetical protein
VGSIFGVTQVVAVVLVLAVMLPNGPQPPDKAVWVGLHVHGSLLVWAWLS